MANKRLKKGKLHPRTGHEGQQQEWKYSSTLSLTSALDGAGVSTPRSGRFKPGKKPGTHCTGRLKEFRGGMDGCGKFCPHQNSIPGPS
jgi:hypothetical protein